MLIMGGVKRIVAVDDSNVVLKMLQNVLDKEKYELHPFSTGTRALEYLVQKEKIPDLIILDIEMPGMNGYEVLERIKKMDHLENVPVIFLTANGEKKQVIKAVTGGVKDYIVKPIDKEILTKKLEALWRGQPAGDTDSTDKADKAENADKTGDADITVKPSDMEKPEDMEKPSDMEKPEDAENTEDKESTENMEIVEDAWEDIKLDEFL